MSAPRATAFPVGAGYPPSTCPVIRPVAVMAARVRTKSWAKTKCSGLPRSLNRYVPGGYMSGGVGVRREQCRKFLGSIRPPHLISPPQVGMALYPIHLGGEVYSSNSAIKNPPRRSTHLIISSLHREFHVCPTVSFVVTSEGNRAGLPLGGPSPSDRVLGIQ